MKRKIITFEVGDGATKFMHTDQQAFTVVAVSKSGKKITIQRDRATLLNGANSGEPDALTMTPGGFSGHTEGIQRYKYERLPNSFTMNVTLRKDGQWRISGSTERIIKGRHEFYDYNF